jgi:integrase
VIFINRVIKITKAQADELYSRLPSRSKLAFAIGIETGLRVSDILRLKFQDIEQPLRVYVSRVGRVIPYPITNWLYEQLISLSHISPDNYIFSSWRKRNRHIHRVTVWRDIKQAAVGLEFSCSPHSARKFYLSLESIVSQ